jgi:hypothetical protein
LRRDHIMILLSCIANFDAAILSTFSTTSSYYYTSSVPGSRRYLLLRPKKLPSGKQTSRAIDVVARRPNIITNYCCIMYYCVLTPICMCVCIIGENAPPILMLQYIVSAIRIKLNNFNKLGEILLLLLLLLLFISS